MATSAPASRAWPSASAISGASASAAGSRSLTNRCGGRSRWRCSASLTSARRAARSSASRGRPAAVGLGVHRGGRQLAGARAARARRRAARRPGGAPARRRRWPARGRGAIWAGTSAPSCAASAHEQRLVEVARGAWWAIRRSAAAASPEPPPMPAATGTRLVISTRTGGPSQPVAVAVGGQRGGGEVGALDPRADDLVGGPRGGAEREVVGQRQRLHDRDELVAPVGGADRARGTGTG